MEPNQTPSTFTEGGSAIPQVQQPDTSFSGDVTFIKMLQDDLPRFQGINPHTLKRRLVEDQEYFTQFTDDMISRGGDIELQRLQYDDPEAYEAFIGNFRKNFHRELTSSMYAGETKRDTLIDRTTTMRSVTGELPIETYYSIVSKNPEAYEEYGLVRDKKLRYTDSRDDKLAFTQLIKTNDELHRKLVNDRYNQFQEALGHSHNNPALIDDIVKKTQAWVIFDNFGGEGLTQYINALQTTEGETIGERLEARARQRESAFFQNARVNGKDVGQLIEEYVVANEELGLGELTFTPIQPKDDLLIDVPSDLNDFTMAIGLFDVKDKEFIRNDYDDVFENFLKFLTPDDYKDFIDYKGLRTEGNFSNDYKKLVRGALAWALENDLLDSIEDTVKQAGEYNDSEGGEPIYRVNYTDADPHIRLALDILSNSQEKQFNVMFVDSDTIDYRPERRQQALDRADSWKNMLFWTTTELVEDAEGNVKVQRVPVTGGLAGIWNTAATVTLGSYDWVNRFFIENTLRDAHSFTGLDFLGRAHEWSRDRIGTQFSERFSRETDGIMPSAVAEAAPFVQYIGAMLAYYKLLAATGGRSAAWGMRMIPQAKKALDLARYGGNMAGASRVKAIANKMSLGASQKSPWMSGFKFYMGGMAVEATQPEETSFLVTIPQLITGEEINPVGEFYRTRSRAVQRGLDAGASLIMDFLADNLISTVKYGTAQTGRLLGRKEFKGIIYNPEKYGKKFGGFEVVDKPMFRTELNEFWQNLTSGLEVLPMGSVGQTMAKGMVKNIDTMHDFAKVFVDDTNWFVSGIKKDIEDQMLYLRNRLGKNLPELDEVQFRAEVDRQYEEFMNTISKQMYGVLKTSSDELPLRFAQVLDEQVPTLRLFKEGNRPVRPPEIGNYPNHKLVRKGDEVYEVDPKFWTIDLANSLRRQALDDIDPEAIAERNLRRLPESEQTVERATALKQEAETYIGTPVKVNGKYGYVVDYTPDGKFTVRTAEGTVETSVLQATPLTPDDVGNMVIQATNNQASRQKLLPLPRTRPVDQLRQVEEAALRRIDELDVEIQRTSDEYAGEVSRRAEMHKNADVIYDKDPTARGAYRRALTNEIKQLKKQGEENLRKLKESKKEAQRELAKAYQEGPTLQVREGAIPDGVSEEFLTRNRLMNRLFGDPTIDVAQRLTVRPKRTVTHKPPKTDIVVHTPPNKAVNKYTNVLADDVYETRVVSKYKKRITETAASVKKVNDLKTKPFC